MPAPRPKAILFDLDDTLISYSGERREVWTETLAPHLHRCDGRVVDDILQAMEAEMRWFWSDPARHREGRLNMQAARTRICKSCARSVRRARTSFAYRPAPTKTPEDC